MGKGREFHGWRMDGGVTYRSFVRRVFSSNARMHATLGVYGVDILRLRLEGGLWNGGYGEMKGGGQDEGDREWDYDWE